VTRRLTIKKKEPSREEGVKGKNKKIHQKYTTVWEEGEEILGLGASGVDGRATKTKEMISFL